MRKAAIYARFSTELQNDRSIDDQVALCRSFAAREGFEVTQVFADRAKSGGTIVGRTELQNLLEACMSGAFDLIIVEALDRLSRDMEELAGIHKRLSFKQIEIHAVHEGVANTILVGLRGIIGQLYREDNAHKIRRGQEGRVNLGLSSGGRCYGYEPVPGKPGERAIVEGHAQIIRRIYKQYAEGVSPRDIAQRLNSDGVPSPTGGKWNMSTINGSKSRGNGILRNPIYAGKLAWNRVTMVYNPDTGKRISRTNEVDDWTLIDVPKLAIVDAETLALVQKRQGKLSNRPPHLNRRPKRILSGLIKCGACGAGMASKGKDRTGKVRIECSAHKESRSCPDPAVHYLDGIEHRVLNGLRKQFEHPDLISTYVKEYHAERQRLTNEGAQDQIAIEARIAKINNEADRITELLAGGIGDPTRLDARAKELMREESKLREQLLLVPQDNILTLEPKAIERFQDQISDLAGSLGKAIDQGLLEAAENIRQIVDRVIVRKDKTIRLEGTINAFLSGGMMVAEDRYNPTPRITSESDPRITPDVPWILEIAA